MIYHGGFYYYSEARDRRDIYIRRARTIGAIGQDPGVLVWSPPSWGMNSDNVWAQELHLINGKWYIYYAADDGENANHRMWVLESDYIIPPGIFFGFAIWTKLNVLLYIPFLIFLFPGNWKRYLALMAFIALLALPLFHEKRRRWLGGGPLAAPPKAWRPGPTRPPGRRATRPPGALG